MNARRVEKTKEDEKAKEGKKKGVGEVKLNLKTKLLYR